jgi:hypothetical protein
MNNDITMVKLDKERTVKFRRKELKLLEKLFNKKIAKIEFENLGIDELSKMIHLGLVHEDPELTLEKAEELIDDYPHFGLLVKAVMEAFSLAMAGPKVDSPETITTDNGGLETKN